MTLRILSYNIREGGGDRLDRLCEVMRQQDADAIALLEAASRRNAEWLAQALGMELVYGEANNQQGDIAWLSRLPISRARNQRHPALAKTLVEIEVLADDAPVTLFATHLASRWDAVIPEAEVPIILERLREAGDRLHALVGDFNALRPGDPVGEPPGAEIRRGDAVDGAPRRTIQQILGAGYVDCYRSRQPSASAAHLVIGTPARVRGHPAPAAHLAGATHMFGSPDGRYLVVDPAAGFWVEDTSTLRGHLVPTSLQPHCVVSQAAWMGGERAIAFVQTCRLTGDVFRSTLWSVAISSDTPRRLLSAIDYQPDAISIDTVYRCLGCGFVPGS